MASWTLYTASLVGAVALYLMLRPGNRLLRGVGALVGLGVLAWLAKELALAIPNVEGPGVFFFIFALIAVASATRMITHSRPVYCALYFVMVVMSSAGLFLLLEAEFMAFALVIVYAGAILITYLFVLMLAQQAPVAEPQRQADYDVIPREPATAAMVGFVMLAVLSDMIIKGTAPEQLGPPPTAIDVRQRAWRALDVFPGRVREIVEAEVPGADVIADRAGDLVRLDGGEAWVLVSTGDQMPPQRFSLPESAMPDNIEMVGIDLVRKFPASLELAGVILLLAMFGAVVLAQRQIELSEAEKHEAAEAGGAP